MDRGGRAAVGLEAQGQVAAGSEDQAGGIEVVEAAVVQRRDRPRSLECGRRRQWC